MSESRDPNGARPWYRHFWVWFLMVPPAATVIFWITVIWTTAATPSLVVDDYSKIGLTYREQRDRDLAAASLGISARFHAVRDTGGVTLYLGGLDSPPDRLRVQLIHPTEAARDLRVSVERGASGIYSGNLGRSLDAARRIEITPPDGSWRLAGRITPGQSEAVLAPPGKAGDS